MKLSKKVLDMELSPIRKFVPYADAARAAGKKVYGISDSLISRLRRHSSTQLRIMTKKFWLMLIHREFPLFWTP